VVALLRPAVDDLHRVAQPLARHRGAAEGVAGRDQSAALDLRRAMGDDRPSAPLPGEPPPEPKQVGYISPYPGDARRAAEADTAPVSQTRRRAAMSRTITQRRHTHVHVPLPALIAVAVIAAMAILVLIYQPTAMTTVDFKSLGGKVPGKAC
jgi:hypothetical protein